MKGVVLAGGSGTRLAPITRVTNKHLLPIFDEPMIYHPLRTLRRAGATDVLVVLGGQSVGAVARLLGDGHELGLDLTYRFQPEAGGIAQAVGLARDFAGHDPIVVVMGDNITDAVLARQLSDLGPEDAAVWVREVDHPERFGVAQLAGDGGLARIVEKPTIPPSHLAVVGIYRYPPAVFDVVASLKPSARGELEITDVNNAFLRQGRLRYFHLEGFWFDAGTPEDLFAASRMVRQRRHARSRRGTTPVAG